MERFRYGDPVKDSVTGFEGRVTGVVDYYGRRPRQYQVEALVGGHLFEDWIDENRIESAKSCKCNQAVYIHETT